MTVATLCGGCERDAPKPAAPAEVDARWDGLVAYLDSDEFSVHQKLQHLDEFEARLEPDHPYAERLAKRRAVVERAVAAEQAAQASRARTFEAKQAAEADARRKTIESGPLAALAGEVLFAFAPWEDQVEREGFDPVTMQVPSKPARVRHSPFTNMGMGSMRVALRDVMAEVVPDKVADRGEYRERHDRMNASFNALLLGRLGATLFDEDHPGTLDETALVKLLDDVYVGPDELLLGTKARDVYRLFRPLALDYARVYATLHKRFGTRKLVAAYKKGLRKYDGSRDETSMVLFYDEFERAHSIAKAAGLTQTWGASVIVGFWMRRAADGTDDVLVEFLRKVGADYDPELTRALR